jgi:hypothetical protein
MEPWGHVRSSSGRDPYLHMFPSHNLLLAQLLVSGVHPADSTVYHDTETGFAFSQYLAEYTTGSSIAFRIALPSPVINSTYDPVL